MSSVISVSVGVGTVVGVGIGAVVVVGIGIIVGTIIGVGTVIVISLVIPVLFASSTHSPPHEQWLVGLGAGAWACPSFGHGSNFVGRDLWPIT